MIGSYHDCHPQGAYNHGLGYLPAVINHWSHTPFSQEGLSFLVDPPTGGLLLVPPSRHKISSKNEPHPRRTNFLERSPLLRRSKTRLLPPSPQLGATFGTFWHFQICEKGLSIEVSKFVRLARERTQRLHTHTCRRGLECVVGKQAIHSLAIVSLWVEEVPQRLYRFGRRKAHNEITTFVLSVPKLLLKGNSGKATFRHVRNSSNHLG